METLNIHYNLFYPHPLSYLLWPCWVPKMEVSGSGIPHTESSGQASSTLCHFLLLELDNLKCKDVQSRVGLSV